MVSSANLNMSRHFLGAFRFDILALVTIKMYSPTNDMADSSNVDLLSEKTSMALVTAKFLQDLVLSTDSNMTGRQLDLQLSY